MFYSQNSIVSPTKSDRSNEDVELDTDPDLVLAPLDDGRVICLRCTILCNNIIQAKNHYKNQHMNNKSEKNET